MRASQHPFATLALVAVVTVASLLAARGLKLDTDLAGLLPPSFESVRDLESLKARYGGEGYLVVIGRDAEPEALRRFAEDVTPRLAALKGVRYVESHRPTEFFREHALYFLGLDDLKAIRKRLAERKKWEVLHANPFYVDLLDTPPPSLDFSDIAKKNDHVKAIANAFDGARSPYYLDEQRRLIAILVKPAGLASDLQYAEDLVGEVQGLFKHMDLRAYGPHMNVELTGRYKKRVDLQHQLGRDLSVASAAALLLMLGYLFLHFRRFTATLLVYVPLIVGLIWTFGFARIAFGQLNILTAFIGTILTGLGIDHGIHLLSRNELECSLGRCDAAAIFRNFSTTGRGVVVAALTTMAAFAALAISKFTAFYQFGVMAGVGMGLVLVAYLICFPAMLGLAYRLGWRPQSLHKPCDSPLGRLLSKRAPIILAVSVLVSGLAMTGIPKVAFDYDFAALDDANLTSYKLDKIVNGILGHSQTPLVVLAPNQKLEREYGEALRKRMDQLGPKNLVDFVLSLSDLVPDRQEEKEPVIRGIGRLLQQADPEKLSSRQRQLLGQIEPMTRAKPFTRASLPEEVMRRFQGVDGGAGGDFMFIYPAISLTQGDLVVDLARELRRVPVTGGGVIRAAGEAMILADMLKMVFTDARPVLAVTIVLVVLVMWLFMGSFRLALFCFLPAAATLLVTCGLMAYSGLRFNYLNVVMVPVLLGVGVDCGVHLMVHREEDPDIGHIIAKTGRPVVGATLTTVFGFGALLLAHHPGLSSLGKLALLGMAVNFLTCLVGFAALMAVVYRQAGPKKAGEADDLCGEAAIGDRVLQQPMAGGQGSLIGGRPIVIHR